LLRVDRTANALPDHSYRNESIGSRDAARRAGHTPNATPTSAENPNASTIDDGASSPGVVTA